MCCSNWNQLCCLDDLASLQTVSGLVCDHPVVMGTGVLWTESEKIVPQATEMVKSLG